MNKLFLILFLLSVLGGQTQSQKEKLKSLSEALIIKSKEEKQIAIEKANQKGWLTTGKLDNGE